MRDPYLDQFGTDAPVGWDQPDPPEPARIPFDDGNLASCVLVIPPGGRLSPLHGEPKTGVQHPGCTEVADLSLDLDCWYCASCRRQGRVSGAWAAERIQAATRSDAEAVSAG